MEENIYVANLYVLEENSLRLQKEAEVELRVLTEDLKNEKDCIVCRGVKTSPISKTIPPPSW